MLEKPLIYSNLQSNYTKVFILHDSEAIFKETYTLDSVNVREVATRGIL